MGSFSDRLESWILNQWFGNVTTTVSGTLYIGLATSALSDASTGLTAVEPPTVSGGNPTAYARSSSNK